MSVQRQQLGKLGEDVALEHLQAQGYVILVRNYRTDFGEIDIIAQDKNALCFIEVRTRISQEQGHPLESITSDKKSKIIRSSMCYLGELNLWESEIRFDVVSVIPEEEGRFQVEIVQDAFQWEGDENL